MLPLIKTKVIKEYYVSASIIDEIFSNRIKFDDLGNCIKMPEYFGFDARFENNLANMIIRNYRIPGKLEKLDIQLNIVGFKEENKTIDINYNSPPTISGAILIMSDSEVLNDWEFDLRDLYPIGMQGKLIY